MSEYKTCHSPPITPLLSVLRDTLSMMFAESQTTLDFSNMGYWAKNLASEGKIIDAAIVFLLSAVLFSYW